MHRWYVKGLDQQDHATRAAALGCETVLESTSTQVDPASPLPHVIVQTRLGRTIVLPEPVGVAALNAILDEPQTPVEAALAVNSTARAAALARLKSVDPALLRATLPGQTVLDLIVALGL